MIKLSPRLKMTSEMVRKGSRLADIGTDHAYLPTVLILDGTVPCAIAADLRKGPLENAEATVRTALISDKVQLRISDGLKAISANEVDDIVIAGMGGILIKDILSSASWIFDKSKRFILQPQSHDEDVRDFLWKNGFEILEERACLENDKSYVCMSAQYISRTTGHSDADVLLGPFFKRTDKASKAFTKKKLTRVCKRLSAISESPSDSAEATKLQNILNEVSKWQA